MAAPVDLTVIRFNDQCEFIPDRKESGMIKGRWRVNRVENAQTLPLHVFDILQNQVQFNVFNRIEESELSFVNCEEFFTYSIGFLRSVRFKFAFQMPKFVNEILIQKRKIQWAKRSENLRRITSFALGIIFAAIGFLTQTPIALGISGLLLLYNVIKVCRPSIQKLLSGTFPL